MFRPWFVERPALLQAERRELLDSYPTLSLCTSLWRERRLVYHGSLEIMSAADTDFVPIALDYPAEFPLQPPRLIPLHKLPTTEPHTLDDLLHKNNVRFLSARHQMFDGSLCAFELPAASGHAKHVSGCDVLRRVEQWFRAVRRGKLPSYLDSGVAELEAHYERHGDIVGGDALFQKDLPDRGRFIAVLSRCQESYPLLIVTHIETAAGWVTEKLLSKRFCGHVPEEELTRLPEFYGKVEGDLGAAGRWHTVVSEPLPIRSVQQLAKILYPGSASPLDELLSEHRLERAAGASMIIAIRYPSRHGADDHEWLFLRVGFREKSLERMVAPGSNVEGYLLDFNATTAERLADSSFGALRFHDLRKRALELRNQGAVPTTTDSLAFQLLGIGALGSVCALLLAEAGARRLDLWDPAIFDAGNAIRHACGLRAVGLPKAWAILPLLADHNPYCEIASHYKTALTDDPADLSVLFSHTPILSTIADDAVELAFNRRAVRTGTTVYYLRALRAGTAARLVRVIPGQDACLECLALHHQHGQAEVIGIEAAPHEVVKRECGQAVLAASAADLAVVAGMGVRHLLRDVVATGTTNQWVWTSMGIEGHAGLDSPFSHRTTQLLRHPECEVCFPRSVGTATITKDMYDRVLSLAFNAAPNETGGILVGRRRGDLVEILDASDAGPEAVQSPEKFVRDGKHCQRFLEGCARATPGVDYVGDWHSHPAMSAGPSDQDQESLYEIADDPDYLTDCPLSLIVGGTRESPRVEVTSHPLDRFVQRVKLAIID